VHSAGDWPKKFLRSQSVSEFSHRRTGWAITGPSPSVIRGAGEYTAARSGAASAFRPEHAWLTASYPRWTAPNLGT
jgi:hypothetical protein